MRKSSLFISALFAYFGVSSSALADDTPEGFEPFIWAELQKIEPSDLAAILAFDTVGDGSGSLPSLPVARLGADGVEGTEDDLAPPEWVRLGGLLRSAQGDAALARGEAALRSAEAAEEIVDELERLATD